MKIRILTEDDLEEVWPIIRDAYPSFTDERKHLALRLFESSNPFVIIGDPSVPALVRLERYRIGGGASLGSLPVALRNALLQSNGMCVQVTDFYPLPINSPGGAAHVASAIRLLATALRAVAVRYPVVRTQPVWATLDIQLVNFMKNGIPAAGIPAPFPNAGTSGRRIWHTRLIDAALAVDSQAVDV